MSASPATRRTYMGGPTALLEWLQAPDGATLVVTATPARLGPTRADRGHSLLIVGGQPVHGLPCNPS